MISCIIPFKYRVLYILLWVLCYPTSTYSDVMYEISLYVYIIHSIYVHCRQKLFYTQLCSFMHSFCSCAVTFILNSVPLFDYIHIHVYKRTHIASKLHDCIHPNVCAYVKKTIPSVGSNAELCKAWCPFSHAYNRAYIHVGSCAHTRTYSPSNASQCAAFRARLQVRACWGHQDLNRKVISHWLGEGDN